MRYLLCIVSMILDCGDSVFRGRSTTYNSSFGALETKRLAIAGAGDDKWWLQQL
jgi:hypothetical protein